MGSRLVDDLAVIVLSLICLKVAEALESTSAALLQQLDDALRAKADTSSVKESISACSEGLASLHSR